MAAFPAPKDQVFIYKAVDYEPHHGKAGLMKIHVLEFANIINSEEAAHDKLLSHLICIHIAAF